MILCQMTKTLTNLINQKAFMFKNTKYLSLALAAALVYGATPVCAKRQTITLTKNSNSTMRTMANATKIIAVAGNTLLGIGCLCVPFIIADRHNRIDTVESFGVALGSGLLATTFFGNAIAVADTLSIPTGIVIDDQDDDKN
jgi:drug/metabolite transporter (DMT)-like permease